MIPNVFKMLKDFQKLQGEMKKVQEELGREQVVGSSGAGMVEFTVNGRIEGLALKIDSQLLKDSTVQAIEDLILGAVNDGLAKAKGIMQEKMGDLSSLMDVPGGGMTDLETSTE